MPLGVPKFDQSAAPKVRKSRKTLQFRTDQESAAASNVRFVLVDTREPGNVGASARALKNMGFRKLVLVRGPDTQAFEARQMAVTADDVLDAAERVPDVQSAVAGAVLIAATTRRQRELVQPRPTVLREAAAKLLDAACDRPVAILFGNEKWGLPTPELECAGMLLRIPTHPSFPSLNLAQSVLLVAYELRMVLLERGLAMAQRLTSGKRHLADAAHLERLYQVVQEALTLSGFLQPHRLRQGMNTLRGIFSRAQLEEREVLFLLGAFGRLGHPETWQP
jgi:TrmH family RNA methyltransferase